MLTGQAPASGDGSRRVRVEMWLGHYHLYFLSVAVAWNMASLLAFQGSGWSAVICTFIWNVAVIAVLADCFWSHRKLLCERCMRESPVLDPEDAVNRWRPVLRFFHYRHRNWLLFGCLVLFLAGSFFRGFLLDLSISIYMAVSLAFFVMYKQHQRLHPWCPWCPWCRWGDGGEEEAVPEIPREPVFV